MALPSSKEKLGRSPAVLVELVVPLHDWPPLLDSFKIADRDEPP